MERPAIGKERDLPRVTKDHVIPRAAHGVGQRGGGGAVCGCVGGLALGAGRVMVAQAAGDILGARGAKNERGV
jgi:hypothetical protein